MTARIAGNGGDLDPQEPSELDEEFERESQAVARAAAGLQRLGVLVKDLDSGLVDFPALHDGEEVLLCWQVGEDEVASGTAWTRASRAGNLCRSTNHAKWR